MVERQVAVLQPFEIAQHLVFGVVAVKCRMRQQWRLTQQGCGQQGCDVECVQRAGVAEGGEQAGEVVKTGDFVKADGQMRVVWAAKLKTGAVRGCVESVRAQAGGQHEGVEHRRVHGRQADAGEGASGQRGEAVNARGNAA